MGKSTVALKRGRAKNLGLILVITVLQLSIPMENWAWEKCFWSLGKDFQSYHWKVTFCACQGVGVVGKWGDFVVENVQLL